MPAGLLLIAAGALVTRILIISHPIDVLVSKVTPDDAYYYLQAARNIVRGEGPSLDGLHGSNGFHPLWMALLLPLAPLPRDAFVYAGASLGAAIDVVTICALWWAVGIVSQRHSVRAAAVAAYAFNPAVAFSAASGMESSVSLLTLVLLFGLFLRSSAHERSDRFWVLLGLACGFAVLARTDNTFFVLAILGFLMLRRAAVPRAALTAAAVAALVVLPWFVWNLAVFGTPFQASGEAKPLPAHTNFDPDDSKSAADVALHGAGLTKEAFLSRIADTYFFEKPLLGTIVVVLAAGTAIAVIQSRMARSAARRCAPYLLVLSAAVLALIIVHAGVRWHVREWYFIAAIPLAALLLAAALDVTLTWLDRRRPLRYAAVVPLAAVAAIVGAQVHEGLDMWERGRYYWQADMFQAARWVREQTPSDTRIVGFNVGVLAYFDERTTTNVDGVMNLDALDALRSRDLLVYVQSLHPHYFIDYHSFVFGFFRHFWGGNIRARLDAVASFHDPATDLYGPYRIYRFR